MTKATTPHDKAIARGAVLEQQAGAVTLGIPETDYELRLAVSADFATPTGKKASGVIRAQAKRIDRIRTGGKFIEPVAGRPRRVQGRVIGLDEEAGVVIVDAGVPIWCRTGDRQRPADFQIGEMVATDVLSGATFTPSG